MKRALIISVLAVLLLTGCSSGEAMYPESEVRDLRLEAYNDGYDEGYIDGWELGYDDGYYYGRHDLDEYKDLYAAVYQDVSDDCLNEICWALEGLELPDEVYDLIFEAVYARVDEVAAAGGPIE